MENKKKHDISGLNPVESYSPPQLPALQDACNDPALIKELPARWKRNAKLITCIGLVGAGAITLTSCFGRLERLHCGGAGGAPHYVTTPTEQETLVDDPDIYIPDDPDIHIPDDRLHHGGAGGAPDYFLYITEQDALSLILAQLEAAGLDFSADPPGYSIDLVELDPNAGFREIGIELFDEATGVAIALITIDDTFAVSGSDGNIPIDWQELAGLVEEKFAQLTSDIQVRVFLKPDERDFSLSGPSTNEYDVVRKQLLLRADEQLATQVEDLLAWLQSEGIEPNRRNRALE